MKATAPDMTAESLGEEIANAVTHGIGAALSIAGLVVMVVLAAINGTAWSVVGVSVYGAALIVLYLSSTLYHGIPHPATKRVFRVLDHSTIYLLIAGTYTPIALAGLRGGPDWRLLALIWALALFGIVLQLARPRWSARLRVGLYVGMGWLAIAWARPLIASLGWDGAGLLLAGSSAHFLAIVFYMLLVHPA